MRIQKQTREEVFQQYVQDLVLEIKGRGFPPLDRFEEWLENPENSEGTVKEWIEKFVDRYIDTRELKNDWLAYIRSTHPEKTIDEISKIEHCKFLIQHPILAHNFVNSLSEALKIVLPKQLPREYFRQ